LLSPVLFAIKSPHFSLFRWDENRKNIRLCSVEGIACLSLSSISPILPHGHISFSSDCSGPCIYLGAMWLANATAVVACALGTLSVIKSVAALDKRAVNARPLAPLMDN
jgi:hypothetical protein